MEILGVGRDVAKARYTGVLHRQPAQSDGDLAADRRVDVAPVLFRPKPPSIGKASATQPLRGVESGTYSGPTPYRAAREAPARTDGETFAAARSRHRRTTSASAK